MRIHLTEDSSDKAPWYEEKYHVLKICIITTKSIMTSEVPYARFSF